MLTKRITIINRLGLHARAATKFATAAGKFSSQISVELNEKTVDGKSVMSLMLLAASQGTEITILTSGDDEHEAMSAIVELVSDRFGEGE